MTKAQPANSLKAAFREIEHTADLGVELTANDLTSLFSVAGEALYSLIADPSTIEMREEMAVSATGDTIDDLLHAWLCELLALFNVQGFIGKECEIIELGDGQATGKVKGERLDLKRHSFRTEIKGVTYHDFKFWQAGDTWHARVIFDV
jgi:SHS2 domain-containing protein